MDTVYSIYLATNKINGKNYVGFTGDFNRRKKQHIYSAYFGTTLFSRALQEFGVDAFEWTILYQSKDKEHLLREMEGYFILEYEAYTKGYNSQRAHGDFAGEAICNKIRRSPVVFVDNTDYTSNTEICLQNIGISSKAESAEEKEIERYFVENPYKEDFSTDAEEEEITREVPKYKPCKYCSDTNRTLFNGKLLCNTCFPGGKFLSVSKIKKFIKNNGQST